MTSTRLEKLFWLYIDRRTSIPETDELMILMADKSNEDEVNELMTLAWERFKPDTAPFTAEESADILKEIQHAIKEKPTGVFRLWPKIAVAASILVAFSISTYIIFHPAKKNNHVAFVKTDINPGRTQATLTLSNGKKVILTKGLRGLLVQQGNTSINIGNGNSITYNTHLGAKVMNESVQYNTLATVRGEESPYPLVLADGTKVWLNAASSITFPTAFTGSNRTVQITGEAYFEVAHHPRQPFLIKTRGETIEDIGTAFNVNAYSDEPLITTTLISGSIKVTNAKLSKLLVPGQQSLVAVSHNTFKIQPADLEQTLAWKNGLFVFNDENITSIMRKISRWYNVEVNYADEGAKSAMYIGSISRFDQISKLLQMLEATGDIRFEVSGRHILVRSK